MSDDKPPESSRVSLPPSWLVNLVAVVILVAWIVSFIVRMIWPDRTLPPGIDALMLLVAGFLFAGNLKDRLTGNGKGDSQ